MASNTLLTRLVQCVDTTANWAKVDVEGKGGNKVLLKGEIGVEVIPGAEAGDLSTQRFKIGDGVNAWKDLAYAAPSQAEIEAIADAAGDINVIESVKVNGTALVPDVNKAVSLTVNTYELSTNASATDGNVVVTLTESDGTTTTTDDVAVKGAGYAAVTTNASGDIIVTGTSRAVKVDGVQKLADNSDTALDLVGGANVTLSESNGAVTIAAVDTTYDEFTGATSGDNGAAGLVTAPVAGDNTKFLRGDGTWADPANTEYDDFDGATSEDAGTNGLVPAPAAGDDDMFLRGDATWAKPIDTTYAFASNAADTITITPSENGVAGTATSVEIHSISAAKVTGVLDISNIPAAAIERCVVVADDTARFALTTDDVQLGDTVKVTATKKMYMVKDTSNLDSDAGYEEYIASADWSVISNKPTTYAGYGLEAGTGLVLGTDDDADTINLADTAVTAGSYGPDSNVTGSEGTTVVIPNFTVDAQGRLTAAGTITYTSKDTTYSVFTGADGTDAGTSGLVPAPAASDNTTFLRGDGTWATPTNTDTMVTTTPAATTKAYITGTTSATETTGTLNIDTDVYLDTEAGTLVATKFKGALDGNAATATALAASKNFSITGGATAAAVAFDGSDNVALNVTEVSTSVLAVPTGDTLILNGGDAS